MKTIYRLQLAGFLFLLALVILVGSAQSDDLPHFFIDEFTELFYAKEAYYHVPPSNASDHSWITKRVEVFEKISGDCYRTGDKRIVVNDYNCVFKLTAKINSVIFIDGSLEGY